MQAAGGTELQLKFLYDHVDNDLLDKVQITTSVPSGRFSKFESRAR